MASKEWPSASIWQFCFNNSKKHYFSCHAYTNEIKTCTCFLCVTEVTKIPPKHEITSVAALHFHLPHRKQYKYSFSEEEEQRGLHLCVLGQLMGCTYLLSHRDVCAHWLGPEYLAILTDSAENSKASSCLWSNLQYYIVILQFNVFVTGSIIYISCIHVSFCREYSTSNTVRIYISVAQ